MKNADTAKTVNMSHILIVYHATCKMLRMTDPPHFSETEIRKVHDFGVDGTSFSHKLLS